MLRSYPHARLLSIWQSIFWLRTTHEKGQSSRGRMKTPQFVSAVLIAGPPRVWRAARPIERRVAAGIGHAARVASDATAIAKLRLHRLLRHCSRDTQLITSIEDQHGELFLKLNTAHKHFTSVEYGDWETFAISSFHRKLSKLFKAFASSFPSYPCQAVRQSYKQHGVTDRKQ